MTITIGYQWGFLEPKHILNLYHGTIPAKRSVRCHPLTWWFQPPGQIGSVRQIGRKLLKTDLKPAQHVVIIGLSCNLNGLYFVYLDLMGNPPLEIHALKTNIVSETRPSLQKKHFRRIDFQGLKLETPDV